MGDRNREIDWLRGYAVMMVMLHHAAIMLPGPNILGTLLYRLFDGSSGVDLFFVISGYVIAQSFLRKYDGALAAGARPALGAAMRFTGRRLRRLQPAAFVWALVVLVATLVIGNVGPWLPPDRAIGAFLAHVFYLANFDEVRGLTAFGYFWSLALEMQFYLLLPVFLACCRRDRLRVPVLIGLALVWPFVMDFENAWLFRVSGLALGVALYLLVGMVRWDPLARLAHHNRAFTGGLVAALLMVRGLLSAWTALGTVLACLISVALVYAASFERGHVHALGVPRLLDWVGSRSYSLYLAHIPVLLIVELLWIRLLENVGLALSADYLLPVLATAILVTCLAADASYRFIEQPFQRRRGSAVALPAAQALATSLER